MDNFRFDDAYEKVYERDGQSYVFIGSYLAYGISSKMDYDEKARIVEREN